MLVCHDDRDPQRVYQNASAAAPLSKPEKHHRVNIFFTSLDKVLAGIENRFSGKIFFER